ncbi:LysR family transcriptional regulator [Uliginosibacterium sp. H3]|uniref:LysR family transcriptional regulator n=1 Tax=Uliginosibacterium silvisoli TaxID=3114758 RepID=A0ABU6K2Q4_9RHOO|nr:LysR family transcriptional regulator [Uliginosibacterium sp. H3]
MADLRRMAIFAAVVEHGSLSAAGRQLGMSTSAVSQQLRTLEQSFGVTLLHRSTRKISLSDAGQRFAVHCKAMVVAADAAEAQLRLAHDAPTGQLRISAPVGFARLVAPALAPMLAANAGLTLHLMVADEMIDLIEARIDLALRAGRLADSSWSARRLCALDTVLCAAPALLARRAPVQAPADLLRHDWLGLPRDGAGLELELSAPGKPVEQLRIEPRITSNNQLSLQQMCGAGLGIAQLVRADVDDDLRSGRLVAVLPEWHSRTFPIWAVTPQRDAQPAKVRHAIEALQSYLRSVPGASV